MFPVSNLRFLDAKECIDMITLVQRKHAKTFLDFAFEEDAHIRSYKLELEKVFHGKYLETIYVPLNGQGFLFVGCGKAAELGLLEVKEIMAAAAAKCKQLGITQCSLDLSPFVERLGDIAVVQAVLGLGLGGYEYSYQKSKEQEDWDCEFQLEVEKLELSGSLEDLVQEGGELCKDILFARNMVNLPGNRLRPMDFDRYITEYVSDVNIETQTLVYGQLRAMKMEALYGVGGSSEYPPCLLILRYKGNPASQEVYGMIGKGVTCDTGGYCLKGSKSMSGIKGDMAGAAAVTGAMHAIARQKLRVNVTACLPLCENRISQSAILPGDVITGYSGKTIEVLNTDAEGRLILADAVSYGIRNEGITHVLDIATLTGAVWSALGYTIAGSMSDDNSFYNIFEKGLKNSTERYLRFPFGKEHEKMIQSNVADIKNVGGDCCGSITAGLFIREFCEERPWIHLDIAGTAWCDNPAYAFESKGATGAGVTSLYYMIKEAEKA